MGFGEAGRGLRTLAPSPIPPKRKALDLRVQGLCIYRDSLLQNPPNPPLEKGDLEALQAFPPFFKGGEGGFSFSGVANKWPRAFLLESPYIALGLAGVGAGASSSSLGAAFLAPAFGFL